MEKYSITVSTQADACYMNNMIAQRGKRFAKLDFDGYAALPPKHGKAY